MSEKKEPKEVSGCLWKGCLGVIVVAVLLSFAAVWGAYSLYSQMAELTSSEPGEVPVHAPNPEAWAAFQERMNAATAQWQAGQPATLEVTADDLNNLFQFTPGQQDVVGKYFYAIQDGEVKLHMSVPLTWIDGMENQYFNGVVGMIPKLEDGQFSLEITSMKAGDLEAPPQFMQTQKYFDWSGWLDQLGLLKELNQLDSLQVQDNKLILRKDES